MKQPILVGAVIAGVVLTVFARVLGIDGFIGRAAILVVVVLLVMGGKTIRHRRTTTTA